MPELPEVETVRRGLNQVTLNQKILGGDVLLDRTIAHPSSIQDFLHGVANCSIEQWHRRGKYLLAELGRKDDDRGQKDEKSRSLTRSPAHPLTPSPPQFSLSTPHTYLGVHLRMTGQLLWLKPDTPLHKHTRVRLFFEGDRELRFVDQRTFGQMWWVPPESSPETIITGLQLLGLEPFATEFSIAYLLEKLHQRKRPIKNALLDQTIVAGIGNIYADEALFLSGIHPQSLCASLTDAQIQTLHGNIRSVLQASIELNGTTFSSFRSVDGVNGSYGGKAWVYARDGEPCRTCETTIERVKLAGRSAHFCPQCQKVG